MKDIDRNKPLQLGTRDSPLALWQAHHVASRLRALGHEVETVRISTSGDHDLDVAIAELPSSAPFSDRIDRALMRGSIDLAVHSLKDLPVDLPRGMMMAAILPRGVAGEALVSRDGLALNDLRRGARIGTSSVRRRAQLLALRPDLTPVTLRGPVQDRVMQVETGILDAVVLAMAGLDRLGLLHVVSEQFSLQRFLPAPGQAALAVTVRGGATGAAEIAQKLDDENTRRACSTELALLRRFESNPQVAVAAHATVCNQINLHARLMTLDGRTVVNAELSGDDCECLAHSVAEMLSKQGGSPVERSL